MDEPMQDSFADPIKDGAERTQYVSLEIDTQATDGYDNALLDDEAFKQTSEIPQKAPPAPNPEPRYTVPLDQDEPVLDFKFAKPAHKQPVFRPAKPSADATTASSSSGINPATEITSGSKDEFHLNNTTNGPFALGDAKVFSEAIVENNEAELPVEVGAIRRPALKQKDSNAQCPKNVPMRQQKQGISFAPGPISNDRQPIQSASEPCIFSSTNMHRSLRPQKRRQSTFIPPPFPDVQPQTTKRRSTAITRTPQQQPPVSPQKEPHIHVDYDGHASEQRAPSLGHGPFFDPKSETRACSPAATSYSDFEQPGSHMLPKSVANQTRRDSISSKDNDRIGRIPLANMPFPETTSSANPHPGNDQRIHEIARPVLAKKSGRKSNSGAVGSFGNLHNKVQTSPSFFQERGNLSHSVDGRESTTQPQEAARYSGEADDLPDEVRQGIQAHMQKAKHKMIQRIEEKDAKINEISKNNEECQETINELEGTNATLTARFAAMREEADALNERVKSQLEEYKSLGDFVIKHKSEAEEYKHEAENMRTSLIEAKNRIEELQLYQLTSKANLEEAKVLAQSRKSALWGYRKLLIQDTEVEGFKSLKEQYDIYQADLQQERHRSRLLQKELQAQHQEKGLKDTIKDLLDSHCLSVTDRLATQERKLSEAISNTDRENQSKLSDCLRLLETNTGNPPQAPKEVLDMKGLIETLSKNIGGRLQSADDGSETLRNAGTEVMEALKARVETLFEIQDAKKELEERISYLQVANARLDVASRGSEERVLGLQAQLSAKETELDRCRTESNIKSESSQIHFTEKQKELDKCREDLTAKDNELRKAQAKVEAGSAVQNELIVLQATHAKAASDLVDATKQLSDCQAALAEQGEIDSAIKIQNADLKERLRSAEQKAIGVERELSQFKISASESLKRQRVEAETDRRKSLESEKRSHVQKVSNLQRLRVEAEAMAEGLKAETTKLQGDVEMKKQLILALETEKAALEEQNEKQAERLAQLEGSVSQVVEYHSLVEALKATGSDIAQLETKLEQNEQKALVDSQIVNEINESVGALVSELTAVKSRLELYERIEAKVQDYCRKSGISFEANAIDAILEILAEYECRSPLVARTPSRSNGIGNRTAASHASNDKTTAARLQVPNSPEILVSQMPSAPSSSPLPRRGARSIASQRSPGITNATVSVKGSFEEVTREFTTKVTRYRESRTTKNSEDAHRNSPFQSPEVEDSQDIGSKLLRSPNYSSLSELDSDEFDQIDDYEILALDSPENKMGKETARGQQSAAAPKKADVKPSKAQSHNPPSKVQTNKPLKSCLKQTTPRNNLVDDKSMLSSDAVKTPLSDSTSMKPPPSRQSSRVRLGLIPSVQDPIKKRLSNNDHIRGGDSPRSDSKQPLTSVQPESGASKLNIRKRTISSASGGMKGEPPAKQPRLSLPVRDFQAVSPFIPEAGLPMKTGENEVYPLEKAKALPMDFSSVSGENLPQIHMEGKLDYK
ncbi:hypothetical protein V496_02051 [Pseudogymnoascus sp. VKM F-4515 (FW-2607)]|nr:hypothetical protein V496_02051 [Pseudogymnoascus sp. VKM F-4515 (FW-2607)]